jgi:Glycoside hydrolase family 44
VVLLLAIVPAVVTDSASSAVRDPAATPINLTVNAAAGRHPISPYIYGLNWAGPKLATAIGLPVNRWGGDTTDGYNWRLGSYEEGADYFFEDLSDCFLKPGPCTPAYRGFIAADRARGTKTLLNLPLVGFVAKDAPRKHPVTCGFPVSVVGSQDHVDPYDSNCGDGLRRGNPLPSVPTRTGVAVGLPYYRSWLVDLKSRYGTAAHGGVAFYELGNEPSLWSATHRDVHPHPETAAELWSKSMRVATLVKQEDPGAEVLGFSEWGWPGYFCTGADTPGYGCGPTGCTTSPDCANHGHIPMAAWYLKQFAAYDRKTRVRHLDYFDLHYYAQGGSTPDVTRSLWDPTYTDPTRWINAKIDLIPRMKRWVARYYPGTKISLSEYNLSVGNDPVQNALIEADTLGIFAREGLNLATRWPLSNDGNLISDAFKIYRDYDGHHSEFGNTWIRSTSSDQAALAVYGAQRSTDGAYTVLVINKTTNALSGHLALSGFSTPASAATWTWNGGNGIVPGPATPIHAGAIDASYPARSMTLYVIS